MKNKKKLGIYIILLGLVLFGGIFSYFKITYSYFGENLTGQLGALCNVNYHSNYPADILIDAKKYEYVVQLNSDYVVKSMDFDIPFGYEFSHWNMISDDSGTKYKINDTFKLTENIDLYAIWKKVLFYGDINLDGIVNMDDSTLLSKYLDENTTLTDIILSNGDVNVDGKVDKIDADIIKQAVLGTNGYEGLLSNQPVLIYDIYAGTINNSGNNTGGDSTNNNGNNGSGNSSSGNGKPSNNSGNSSSNDNGGNSILDENESSNIEDDEVLENDILKDDDNKNEKLESNINNKYYVWIVIALILLITLRFVVLIIKKIIKIKKEDNNCDK